MRKVNQLAMDYEKAFIYASFQLFYNLSGLKIIRLNEKVQFTLGNEVFYVI